MKRERAWWLYVLIDTAQLLVAALPTSVLVDAGAAGPGGRPERRAPVGGATADRRRGRQSR